MVGQRALHPRRLVVAQQPGEHLPGKATYIAGMSLLAILQPAVGQPAAPGHRRAGSPAGSPAGRRSATRLARASAASSARIGIGHGLRRLGRAAAHEHPQAHESVLLRTGQHAHAPVDGRLQGAVPLGDVAPGLLQPGGGELAVPAQRQQLLHHDLRRQLAQPHRGQLQGQRQPIQRHTQRRQRQEIVGGQREGRVGRTHPAPAAIAWPASVPRSQHRAAGARSGAGSGRQRPFLLAVQIQRHAAGAKQLQVGRPGSANRRRGACSPGRARSYPAPAAGGAGPDRPRWPASADWPAEGVRPSVRRTAYGTSPAAATSARGQRRPHRRNRAWPGWPLPGPAGSCQFRARRRW